MKEGTLTLIALSFAILGFVGLIVIVLTQNPVEDAFLDDTLVSFSAKLTNIRHSEKGSILEFDYVVSSSGFIDRNITLRPDTDIKITARKSGDFFFIVQVET